MLNVDFIKVKTIIFYLLAFTIILLGGMIWKNGFAILIVSAILFFALTKNIFITLEILLIWLVVYNFFLSQGFITNDIISKYIAKPSLLLFIALLFFFKNISLKYFRSKHFLMWIIFIITTLLSSLIYQQSPFVILSVSSFFFIYYILQTKSITTNQYKKILNLFIASAVLQTIISILQISEIIPPGSTIMDDGSGGQFEFIVGLDDAACGTFGAGSSHTTSWYSALISLLLIINWVVTRRNIYLAFTAVIFLQFATIDSKTIFGVTILMLMYMILYIFKKKNSFKINIKRYIIFLCIITVGFGGFVKAWNSYYEYFGNKTGGERTDLNAVYKNEVEETRGLIFENIKDWGKIKGFQYLFEDFIENDPSQIIWGYGIQGYNYNGKMGYIENKDTPVMKLNNLTNSRSGLITRFATSGFVGFVLFLSVVYLWFKFNIRMSTNNYDLIRNSLLKIFLPFSLIGSFLYSIEITSIPIIIFSAIISIYLKLSLNNHIV